MSEPAIDLDIRETGHDAAPGSPAPRSATRLVNAMSVDVEDYFQVSAFAGHISRDNWERMPRRVERNTDRVLALFGDHGVHATFFVLGWVAERHPGLVRRIVASGHELASHGYAHRRVGEQSPESFRDDVRRARRLLEDISGVEVRGYRAPSFSIGAETLWAHAALAEEGYRYSTSVYPIRHDHYGMPDAPRFQYRTGGGLGLREIPVTTLRLFDRNLPCGGGGYFRLLPYGLSRWAMRRVNRVEGQSCMFYFHPWEIDPDQPVQRGVSLKVRVRHYANLRRMERKLDAVLADFAWDRIDRVFPHDGQDGQDGETRP